MCGVAGTVVVLHVVLQALSSCHAWCHGHCHRTVHGVAGIFVTPCGCCHWHHLAMREVMRAIILPRLVLQWLPSCRAWCRGHCHCSVWVLWLLSLHCAGCHRCCHCITCGVRGTVITLCRCCSCCHRATWYQGLVGP